jgi:hypothetical protein
MLIDNIMGYGIALYAVAAILLFDGIAELVSIYVWKKKYARGVLRIIIAVVIAVIALSIWF